MDIRFLVVAVILLGFSSCYQHEEKPYDLISVPMVTNVGVDDLIEKVDMVRLETAEECLLGDIKRIFVDENYFYLVDELGHSVYIFMKSGDYVSKISRYGEGPNEYLEISDLDVRNGLVYVLSNPNKRILVYNKQGDCLSAIKLHDWFHHLAVEENYILLHSGKSNEQYYNLITIDYEGNVLTKHLPYNKNNNFRYKESPFNVKNGGGYLLTFPYDGRIVSWTEEMCMYQYKMEFESQVKLTDKELDELLYDEIRKKVQYQNSLKRINAVVSLDEDNLFMIVTAYYDGEGERQALCKVNVKDGSSKFYKLGERLEDKYPYLSNLLMISDGCIYSSISPFQKNSIDEYMENNQEHKNDEECNPIICVYKIRNDNHLVDISQTEH